MVKNEKLRNACMGALFEIYESKLPEGLTHKENRCRVTAEGAVGQCEVQWTHHAQLQMGTPVQTCDARVQETAAQKRLQRVDG